MSPGELRLKILIVSSEVHPFAKTGGLADVAGALPLELAALGHDVRVVLPRYASVDEERFHILPILGDIRVRLGDDEYVADIMRTALPDSSVPTYFVENPGFFDREGLYLDPDTKAEYPDNAVRFAFFCKAVIWLLKGLDWTPDVIQCNDWQTALIPVYLRTDAEMKADPALQQIKTLFTIHNLAYQGVYSRAVATGIGIGDELFHPAALEFYAQLNLLKGGIIFADRLSTVSRRYAEEIQTPEYGCGLEGVLQVHRHRLTGILNGIDATTWDPATDPHIPAHYSPEDLSGKAECKAALQRELGLPENPATPLVGIISRLDPQKGFDLIAKTADEILAGDVQLVLLGTGMPTYHEFFTSLARRHPGKAAVRLTFDNPLAHRIEAGSDLFLMPSRYEPCGLNQLYSLRYGTIPVVRRTGGLADSITDATIEAINNGSATGFCFDEYSAAALGRTMDRALACYRKPDQWARLRRNAMAQDFSWNASARKYEALFVEMTGVA